MKAVWIAFVMAGLAAPAAAEVPAWLTGEWATSARLTAPDGARLRIRCTMEANADGDTGWVGVLGCATVQGRFQSRWGVAISGGSTNGTVRFEGPETSEVSVRGDASDSAITLASDDGQSVEFTPGADGALVVDMTALGPQRLSGALTFEAR